MKQATALMTELVDSLALLHWTKLELAAPLNAQEATDAQGAAVYQGLGAGWIVTVMTWQIREADREGKEQETHRRMCQERGYDGTCAKDGMLVHLTRDVAEKVFLYAEERMKP